MKKWTRLAVVSLLAGSIAAGTSGMAQASPLPSGYAPGQQSAPQITETPKDSLALNRPALDVQVSGTSTLLMSSGPQTMGITLPGTPESNAKAKKKGLPAALQTGQALNKKLYKGTGDPLLSTTLPHAALTSYKTTAGTQTLITIDSAAAATEYRFPLNLPQGSSAAIQSDGSVSIKDSTGLFLGGYSAPWAIDADGTTIPSTFTVEGNTLIQQVEFTTTTSFPVTADPSSVWGWAVCVATVGINIVPWGAGAKIAAKLITRFGSVKRGIEIIYRAYHAAYGTGAKWAAAMAASGGLFAQIVGIDDVKNACFS